MGCLSVSGCVCDAYVNVHECVLCLRTVTLLHFNVCHHNGASKQMRTRARRTLKVARVSRRDDTVRPL